MLKYAPRRGFTLIELLVVISIIALLSSVVLASLNAARDKARTAAGRQFDANVYHAAGDQATGVWDFDECSGTATASDRSGNNYHLNLVNSPSWASDSPYSTGCSLSFNGSQRAYFSTTAFDRSNGQEITVSAWIKPGRLGGQYQQIVSNRSSGTTMNWQLYQHITDGSLQLHGLSQNKSGYIPSLGVWSHVAAVVNASGDYKLYINGEAVQAVAGYTYYGAGPQGGVITIGAQSSGGEPYLGNIDQVRVYAKALTASEVGKLYVESAPKYRFADAE